MLISKDIFQIKINLFGARDTVQDLGTIKISFGGKFSLKGGGGHNDLHFPPRINYSCKTRLFCSKELIVGL